MDIQNIPPNRIKTKDIIYEIATDSTDAPRTDGSTPPAIKAPMKINIAPIIQNTIDLASAMNISFVFSYINLMVSLRLIKNKEVFVAVLKDIII